MTGIEENQVDEVKKVITNLLKIIPEFEKDAEYISLCIVNGLIMEKPIFHKKEIGIVNAQNNSVRNIDQYPRYKDDVIELNKVLEKIIQSI